MLCLVLCEESQTITKLLRDIDIEAYSVDLKYCSGGKPEYHIIADALEVLKGGIFSCQDYSKHLIKKPDVIIAHPPCTYLTQAGANKLYYKPGVVDEIRFHKGLIAAEFFMSIYNADVERICIENPRPMKIFKLPKYSMIISPDECGSEFSKMTCLWLKNIPKFEGDFYKPKIRKSYVYQPGVRSPEMRSKTDINLAKTIVYNIFQRSYIY